MLVVRCMCGQNVEWELDNLGCDEKSVTLSKRTDEPALWRIGYPHRRKTLCDSCISLLVPPPLLQMEVGANCRRD